MSHNLISAKNVSLGFELSHSKKFGILDNFKSLFEKQMSDSSANVYQALKNVSFEVNSGDVVGIIGENGSGKSTLLRVISGIYPPDSGSMITKGRVSTLLSLGTGFDNRLNGRENIILNGLLQGMKREDIELRIDEILNFADIGNYVEQPMKYYSSGMISRLSFSITLFLEPEILLLDEIFSVGDIGFQDKSREAMEQLRKQSSAQVIVSHDLSLIEDECNKVIFMSNGKIHSEGKPKDIVELYKSSFTA